MAEDKTESKPEAGARQSAGRRSYWIWIAGPVAAFLVLVALVLSTGTPSSAQLMKHAATSFGDVKKGTFRFAITITPQGSSTASPSSIELTGPFEIVPGKPLPLARITYTVSSGGRSQVVTLLTTGDKAYSLIKGQAYELPASATKDLKSATKDLSKGGSGTGLSGIKLNFDKWLINPQVSPGADIDGTATWRTTAGVNVVEAVKDLTASAGALGSITGQKAVTSLKSSDIKAINKQIKDAHVVVYVGRYDNIVRLMDLTMDFKTPSATTAQTGGISGGKANLVVGISEPNKDVDVKLPKNPLPYSALQSLVNGQSSQTGTALDDGLGQ